METNKTVDKIMDDRLHKVISNGEHIVIESGMHTIKGDGVHNGTGDCVHNAMSDGEHNTIGDDLHNVMGDCVRKAMSDGGHNAIDTGEDNVTGNGVSNVMGDAVNSSLERKEESYSNPAFTFDTEAAANEASRDLVITGRNMTQASNNTATQEPDTVATNDRVNENVKDKLRRLCSDKLCRTKVLRTVFILWNFTMFGWTMGIAGPTLPDLQLLTGASLQQASWLFTGWGIGYLVSCSVSGFVHYKVHPDILLFLYTATQAISAGALPWLPNIHAMVVIRGVLGYCNGGQDIELTAMLFSVWKSEAGPYFQLTHFFFAIGGILSPLVAKSFLIQITPQTLSQNTTGGLSGLISNDSAFTMDRRSNCSAEETVGKIMNASTNIDCDGAVIFVKNTNVQFAYLISAVVVLSAALPFLVYFITGSRKVQENEESQNENAKKVSSKIQVLVVTLLCIVSAIGTAVVDSIANYLASFGILQLDWSEDMGSSMTSLYFATYAVGNLIGVFILKCITSRSFVYLTYITSIGSIALLYIGVYWTITVLQTIAVAAIGLSMSAILPTIFTWTQQAVTQISGVIASALLFAGSVGTMANPILLGYLMESVTPMWYLYLSILETIFCFAIFIIADLITRKLIISDLHVM